MIIKEHTVEHYIGIEQAIIFEIQGFTTPGGARGKEDQRGRESKEVLVLFTSVRPQITLHLTRLYFIFIVSQLTSWLRPK